MKKKIIILTFLFSVLALFPANLHCWGFFAHKRINRIATFTLPKEMFKFYKTYIDYITEHSVDPDKRRYASKDEAPRHYIDIDHYGDNPFDAVPKQYDSAVAKFTEDTLIAYGTSPWHINKMYYWLRKAFFEKDRDKILRLSAEIGHYIGDAHVPLHTTENYNGQLTNQKGIHGFWESRLPELFAESYNYTLPKARYIGDPLERIWVAIEESHAALDSVLSFEKELTESTKEGGKYAHEERGVTIVKTYSRDFSKNYHTMLNGMVERRMRKAMHCIGSFWYSAWIDAGQPDLNDLVNDEASKDYLKTIDDEKKTWKRGKWLGRPEEE